MIANRSTLLRALPRVDDLIATLQNGDKPSPRLREAARAAINEMRAAILQEQITQSENLFETTKERAQALLQQHEYSSPRRVLNATGIIVHTGLGRSLLSRAATEAVARVAASHCALEVDIETGERGRRDGRISALLGKITECEDATVCNNNAGATLLALNTLAAGREVLVSRGELVEIGGGFRMPDVMQASGAILREVGTTNKTRLEDYANAVTENTAAILKVHTSNYRVVGFTEEVLLPDLVRLARDKNIKVIEDLGSGALVDLSRFGLCGEPRVQDSVASGADVVCFSGDKLLGGPQCGVLCGKRETIEAIHKNQLLRALRCDKFTLAAMEATLAHYLDEAEALREIPTLAALSATLETVKRRAEKLKRLIGDVPAEMRVLPSQAQAGAGALPTQTIPSFAVAITPQNTSLDEFARRLRLGEPSVWGRIHDGVLLLDCRTLRDVELKECAETVAKACL